MVSHWNGLPREAVESPSWKDWMWCSHCQEIVQGIKRIKKAFFLSARRNLTQWEPNHPDTMNACRRIHSLRAHRQKTNGNKSENWHSTSGFKHQHGDDLVTVHTLYTVIIMVLLVALWGAWSRKDSAS